MYIIDVVPFVRGAPAETLSYRSKTAIVTGTIVSVPLRRRTVTAVVTRCVSVRDAKSFLKSASFIPRNVVAHTLSRLPNVYYDVALKVAQRHAVAEGEILRQLFTNDIIATGFPSHFLSGKKFIRKQSEAPYENRLRNYCSLCEEKQEKGTVLFVVPTSIEAKRLANDLSCASVVIQAGKQARRRQEKIREASNAHVVIVTAAYAFIPIIHLKAIVIERESADTFTQRNYPYTDMRIALDELAQARHTTLLIGDYPIRLETRSPHNKSLQNKYSKNIYVLSTRQNDIQLPDQSYTTLPIPVRQIIKRAIDENGRVLLLCVRRGYAATVVCKDCGEAVRDTHGRALSLATVGGKRVFRSADGTIMQSADIHCSNCDSWNLVPLGVGIERVEEDVKKYFPTTPKIRFDSDTITTKSSAARALQEARVPGTILLATEQFIIPYLEKDDFFSSVLVVSADSLLAVPFWRSRERFIRMVFTLAQHTTHMTVATRRPRDTVCLALTQQNLSLFLDEELSLRKTLHYPPYGYILLFKIIGNEQRLMRAETIVRDALHPDTPICLPDRLITENKRVRVLIYKQEYLPNKEVSQRLAKLPRFITHTINGESLWL